MCYPMVIAAALTLASTAMSMASQAQQTRTQKKAAEASATYNAQLAENEAANQRALAQNEVTKGVSERNRHMRAASQGMGQMRSMLGASGFTMDSGSSTSMLADQAEEYQYDADIITQNANMAAWQHNVAATSANNQKSMFDYQYANAGANKTASMLSQGSTLLGGIAQGMSMYAGLSGTATAGGKFKTPSAKYSAKF